MGALEYWFGIGDGEVTTWASPADLDLDGDGEYDSVRVDFDGDGLFDDAMWDSDGDGVADRAVLDADGPSARFFTDPARHGVWEHEVSRTETVTRPVVSPSGWRSVDYDGDGAADDAVVDLDGDGTPDVALLATRGAGYDTVLVAGDDPDRLTVRLTDTDGDGRLDTVSRIAP